jgi:hypothetical protein
VQDTGVAEPVGLGLWGALSTELVSAEPWQSNYAQLSLGTGVGCHDVRLTVLFLKSHYSTNNKLGITSWVLSVSCLIAGTSAVRVSA